MNATATQEELEAGRGNSHGLREEDQGVPARDLPVDIDVPVAPDRATDPERELVVILRAEGVGPGLREERIDAEGDQRPGRRGGVHLEPDPRHLIRERRVALIAVEGQRDLIGLGRQGGHGEHLAPERDAVDPDHPNPRFIEIQRDLVIGDATLLPICRSANAVSPVRMTIAESLPRLNRIV